MVDNIKLGRYLASLVQWVQSSFQFFLYEFSSKWQPEDHLRQKLISLAPPVCHRSPCRTLRPRGRFCLRLAHIRQRSREMNKRKCFPTSFRSTTHEKRQFKPNWWSQKLEPTTKFRPKWSREKDSCSKRQMRRCLISISICRKASI